MRWQEIYDVLKNYESESRKGWYSYTWCNGFVSIARRCDPERIYTLNTRDNRVFIEVPVASEEPDVYYWHTITTDCTADELVDADDYFITSTVSHPYIAMLNIKEAEVKTQPPVIFKDFQYHSGSEINEKRINLRALNNIKAFIYEQDRYCYNKHWSYPMPEAEGTNGYIADNCAWCGISYNDYVVANFYFNGQEFYICTNGDVAKENKHRRHFKEQEWLFPWQSNKLEKDRVLYIRTSSLKLYKRSALKNKKEEITKEIKTILKYSGLENYELIEIRKPYKFQNI